ncbi:MAG: YegP family protein [Bacilli bacterium]|nr:YegP family protein [Bacilli bacterium]
MNKLNKEGNLVCVSEGNLKVVMIGIRSEGALARYANKTIAKHLLDLMKEKFDELVAAPEDEENLALINDAAAEGLVDFIQNNRKLFKEYKEANLEEHDFYVNDPYFANRKNPELFYNYYLVSGIYSFIVLNEGTTLMFDVNCLKGLKQIEPIFPKLTIVREGKVAPKAAPKKEVKKVVKKEPAKEEKVAPKEEPVKEEKPAEKKEAKVAPVAEEKKEEPREVAKTKTLGKFEVYPEAGAFKYRLKANNGEILVVSQPYTTRDGAKAGIETLKKTVPEGVFKYNTDKNNFSQWKLFNADESRVIAIGETYSTLEGAKKASDSVVRFYVAEKIVDLDEIPTSENREWIIEVDMNNPLEGGRVELYKEDDKWRGNLVASNGEILFATASTYSSKSGLLGGLDAIKARVKENCFHIVKNKQERYQFVLYTANNIVLIRGESYSSRGSAENAARSVVSFLDGAEIVDTTVEPKDGEAE